MGRSAPVWILAAASAVLAAAGALARGDPPPEAARHARIHVIDFEGEIEPALSAYVRRRLDAAKADRADLVVLRIDSPGGRVDSSTDIADAILGLDKSIRTIAWVPERAFSGATMVALACDEIVMGPSATIGDCQPILLGPQGITPVGEKIETVLRAQFRRYAEDNGWPPLLAEKMVSVDLEVVQVRHPDGRLSYVNGSEFDSARDEDLVGGSPKGSLTRVRVVVPKGRLLTLTTAEAREYGFVRRVFDGERAFLDAISAPGASVTQVRMSWMERASRWLLGAAGVLAGLVALCAAITVFQGIGTATIVGIAALAVTGLVVVTSDLAMGFPLLLVGLGILLLAAEAFLIPGFGVAGILGILSVAAGFLFLGGGASFSGPDALSWRDLGNFLLEFAATAVVAGTFFVLLARWFPRLPFAGRGMVLAEGALGAGAAVPPATTPPRVGAVGRADTDLRPAGRAIVDGRLVDVTSEGDFVEAGTAVHVLRVEGTRVVVRPVRATGARS